jgi:hypothetical protein
MSRITARLDPNSPAIRRKAARYERKLEQALKLARKRDRRCSDVLKTLYRDARVEKLSAKFPRRLSVIAFESPPFHGGLYKMFYWKSLDTSSISELADDLMWSLREDARRKNAR